MEFDEISSSCSLEPIERTIKISTNSSVATLKDVTTKDSAGSFCYPVEQHQIPAVRNRFFVWKASGNVLRIEESSLDYDLQENSLVIQFENSLVLPGTSIFALGEEKIVILVPTVASVFRIALPHPVIFHRAEPINTGGGKLTSILSSITVESVLRPKHWENLDDAVNGGTPLFAATSQGPKGGALFAVALDNSAVLIVNLPAESSGHASTQHIVWPNSGLAKKLTGLFSRSEDKNDVVVDMVWDCERDDASLFAISRDGTLRVWTNKGKSLRCQWDLKQILEGRTHSSDAVPDSVQLRKCVTSQSIFFCAHLQIRNQRDFLIFTMSKSKTDVVKAMEFEGPKLELVDFAFTATYLWTLWTDESNKLHVKFKRTIPDELLAGYWEDVNLLETPSENITKLSEEFSDEDGEMFRELAAAEILSPGLFSRDTILRSIKVTYKTFRARLDHELNNASNLYEEIVKCCVQCCEDSVKDGGFNDSGRVSSMGTSRFESSLLGGRTGNTSIFRDPARVELSFWKSLWSSCCQYHKAETEGLALLSCPEMELFGIIRRAHSNFFTRTDPVIQVLPTSTLGKVTIEMELLNCLKTVESAMGSERLAHIDELFRKDENGAAAREIKETMESFLNSDNGAILLGRLTGIMSEAGKGFSELIGDILLILDPQSASGPRTMDTTDQGYMAYDNYLRSRLASGFLASAFEISALRRYELSRNLFLFLEMWKLHNDKFGFPVSMRAIEKQDALLWILCHGYAVLCWAAHLQTKPDYSDLVNRTADYLGEAQLDEPARLSESELRSVSRSSRPEKLLSLLFRSKDVGGRLRRLLYSGNRGRVGALGWGAPSEELVSAALETSWPRNPELVLPDFLRSARLFHHLLKFCSLVKLWTPDFTFLIEFLEAFSLLELGFPDEALAKFLSAYKGVKAKEPAMIRRLFLESVQRNQYLGGDYINQLTFFFESRNLNSHVLKLTDFAMRNVEEEDEAKGTLRIVRFKALLKAQSYEVALSGLRLIPDTEMRLTCLRQLIVSLLDSNHKKQLVALSYGSFESEVLRLLESKVRVSDLSEKDDYDLLFAFQVHRKQFRLAATYMYELSQRLIHEVPNVDGLRRASRAMKVAIQSLSLASADYRWIATPQSVGDDVAQSPKRNTDGSEKSGGEEEMSGLDILEIPDLQREAVMLEARLNASITNHAPTRSQPMGHFRSSIPKVAEEIAPPTTSPEEVLSALLERNQFDLAARFALSRDLSLNPLIEAVVAAAVETNKAARFASGAEFRDDSVENPTTLRWRTEFGVNAPTSQAVARANLQAERAMQWLDSNRMIYSGNGFNASAEEECWNFLEAYLDHLGRLRCPAPLYRAAGTRFLAMGHTWPSWFLAKFKMVDFPECLRSLLIYDHLEEAASLSINYLDALLGSKLHDFGLKNSVRPDANAVWVPYTLLDNLSVLLAEKKLRSPTLLSKASEFSKKLDQYLTEVEKCSKNRMMATR